MSEWRKSRERENSGSEGRRGEAEDRELGTGTEPSKTIRCVIEKDPNKFERLGSGDCPPPGPRRENTRLICANAVDSLRLKNHLEWKKQKEMEYLRRREEERLEEDRRKKERIREEEERRRREKEKEEKLREWEEQKIREKEERKREEAVLKALEQEMKGVVRTVDKEKLMREWLRLKNKQKQLEAERKAELIRKEEEARALREQLAKISYMQWKEKTKTRRITLPKNGYQIFATKPVPVVKEDWNHDFVKGDEEEEKNSIRGAKSTVSMMSIRGSTPSRTEFSLQIPLHDLKKKSQSNSQLSVGRSKTNVAVPSLTKFPVHQETGRMEKTGHQTNPQREVQRNQKIPPNGFTTKLFNVDALPAKNKLNIYLQTSPSETSQPESSKQLKKNKKPEEDNLKKYLQGFREVNTKLLIDLNEKLSASDVKSRTGQGTRKGCGNEFHSTRSRSYDRPIRKAAGNRSASVAEREKAEEAKKPKKSQSKMGKTEGRKKTKKGGTGTRAESTAVESPYCVRKSKVKCRESKGKETIAERERNE